ncbi:putative Permease of the major facilitator superfamily [Vibrio nigripulchritudo SOn1]|uniref:Permease of the major facilitator superfamily n=1 Tax=Vibrio nigripulchritudo SOn1 TaxID=1238450 RepID=A0AAV2VKI8_9VIBR|nr:MFS transporter [Vibrio nigripulchritudo]CCO45212.1 putative Permease of the major facilitator superfamily [Vibrio nigripulchritudo SOn1]
MNRLQLSHRYGLFMGLFFVSQFVVLPVMTPIFMSFGMTIPQIGMIMATMGITVMLLELPTGGLADQIGRKKVFLGSIAFSASSYLTLLLLPTFAGGVIAMFLWGASIAISSGTLTAWFVETFNQSEGDMTLQTGFSRVGVRTSFFAAVGALLCAGIMFVGNQWGYDDRTLYDFALSVGLICLVLVFAIGWVWVKEQREFQPFTRDVFTTIPKQVRTGVIAAKHPVLWRLLFAMFLTIPIASAIEKFWPVRFEDLAGEQPLEWVYGFTYAVTMFLGSAAAAFTNWMTEKLNQQMGKVLVVSVMFRLIAATVFALSGDLILFVLLFICYDFTNHLGKSAYNHLLHHATDDNVRSTIDSLNSLVMRVGGVTGSLLCGFGAAYVGLINIWLLCVVIGVGALFLFKSPLLNESHEPADSTN